MKSIDFCDEPRIMDAGEEGGGNECRCNTWHDIQVDIGSNGELVDKLATMRLCIVDIYNDVCDFMSENPDYGIDLHQIDGYTGNNENLFYWISMHTIEPRPASEFNERVWDGTIVRIARTVAERHGVTIRGVAVERTTLLLYVFFCLPHEKNGIAMYLFVLTHISHSSGQVNHAD